MTLQYITRKVHKWAGLVLALQLFFWIVGGVIMSSFPLTRVHGDHTRAFIDRDPLNFTTIYPLEKVLPSIRNPIESVSLRASDRGLIYDIKIQEWRSLFYDAKTGKQLSSIERDEAERIANINYHGPGSIIAAALVDEGGTEYRGVTPVWRIEFDDWESTTFYIAPDSGFITASRNTYWRIFDFVWMLHIMDYEEREDFNNWLLIAFSSSALLFCFSGMLLLIQSPFRRDIKKLLRLG